MDMKEWAELEVKIACEKERGESNEDGMWDYGCACYESALKAFNSLLEDGHSGMSIGVTKQILNRLIDGKPLTPIEDVDEVWKECSYGVNEDITTYQCKRMSSLFKDVFTDGRIEYHDVNRFVGIDIENGYSYHSGLVDKVMHKKHPITMPYNPSGRFKVYCEDFLTDRANGDFDTMGILYCILPDGSRQDIDMFFKESITGWKEITLEEYSERKARKL